MYPFNHRPHPARFEQTLGLTTHIPTPSGQMESALRTARERYEEQLAILRQDMEKVLDVKNKEVIITLRTLRTLQSNQDHLSDSASF